MNLPCGTNEDERGSTALRDADLRRIPRGKLGLARQGNIRDGDSMIGAGIRDGAMGSLEQTEAGIQASGSMQAAGTFMKTLFLQAPSYDGFDGGAGSRYQAKREIRSFWYPTWLAQPAALVPGSRLLDAPADGLSVEASLDDRAAVRPRHHPHQHAVVPDRRAVRAGPEGAQAVGADRHGRREGRGRPA